MATFTIIAASALAETIGGVAIWLGGLWLACLGACIGSFLNVVIYRVPVGQSIVRPGSRCPRCAHPIRWYDNVPVLSWFMLRGRCRDCGAPVSGRYPFVEALVAALFVGLAWVELFLTGTDLPAGGVDRSSLELLAGIYAYHVLLLVTLIAVAFINFDGQRVPWSVVAPALLIGLLAPAMWPRLHPVSFWPGLSAATLPADWLVGLGESVAGVAAGLVVGLLTFPLATAAVPRGGPPADWKSMVTAASLTGAFLGWPAAIAIGAITSIAYLLATVIGRWLPAVRRMPWTGWLMLATLIWIVAWRPIFAPLAYVLWLRVEIAVYSLVVILCASTLARTT